MKLKQNFYKLNCTGVLKNGFKISTTFEVNFGKEVTLDSEEYITTEKEVRNIISSMLINYNNEQ